MSKLDQIKEILNTLRLALSLLTAFLIALGGAIGTLFKSGDTGFYFGFACYLWHYSSLLVSLS
jgi:hypothetical protein